MRFLYVLIVQPASMKQASVQHWGWNVAACDRSPGLKLKLLLVRPFGRPPWPVTTGTFTFLLEREGSQSSKCTFPVFSFNRSHLIRQQSTGPEVIFPDFQSEGKNGTQPNKLWDPICLLECTHAWTFNFWLSSPPSGFALHPADRISCQREQGKRSPARLFLSANTVSGLHPYVCASLLLLVIYSFWRKTVLFYNSNKPRFTHPRSKFKNNNRKKDFFVLIMS